MLGLPETIWIARRKYERFDGIEHVESVVYSRDQIPNYIGDGYEVTQYVRTGAQPFARRPFTREQAIAAREWRDDQCACTNKWLHAPDCFLEGRKSKLLPFGEAGWRELRQERHALLMAQPDHCQCWNEGQYGRVHREDCPIHREEH